MKVLDRLHLRRRRGAATTSGHERRSISAGHEHVRGWAKDPGRPDPHPQTEPAVPREAATGEAQPHGVHVRAWAKEPTGPDGDAGTAGMHRPPAHDPHVRAWAKEPGGAGAGTS